MKLALFTLLMLLVAALAHPVEPEPSKDLETKEDIEPTTDVPKDDLKTDATFWGWGYRPYHNTYYYNNYNYNPWGYSGGYYGEPYYGWRRYEYYNYWR